MAKFPPVIVVEQGGAPFVQVAEGVNAPPMTVVDKLGFPITLVDKGAPPVALFNVDDTPYTGGDVPITLPFDPVLLIVGDSNARGSAEASDQSAFVAAYTPDPMVKVLQSSPRTFVDYVPGTLAGLNAFSNQGNVGPEIGFIPRFREMFPNNTLYIAKLASAGSFQSRGVVTGSITASISGNVLTRTAGTLTPNTLVVGGTTPLGTYVPFANGSDPLWFVQKAGEANNKNYTVPSTTMDKYDFTRSFSSAEGGLWNGVGNTITTGYRARLADGKATLATPKIIACLHLLGTNDASDTTASARYAVDLNAFIDRIRADQADLVNGPIMSVKVRSGGANSATIRAAQDAAVISKGIGLINGDDLTVHDGTHYNIAGLQALGDRAFDAVNSYINSLA